MRNRITRMLLPLLAFGLVAAAADVQTDYDHHADFGRYHTYCWIGVKAGNSLWQDRIMNAVDNSLEAKGWQKSNGGNCDASVSAFGKTTEQQTLQTFYDGFPGWGWRGWGGMGEAYTETIPNRVGTLTVDIFDTGTKHLLWRGTAENTLTTKPEKNEKKLDDAVNDMFKHFPPNKG